MPWKKPLTERDMCKRVEGYVYKVLTIAGSDCSGGAGIQADLKTIMAHGMYGMSAITAVTVQNTMGVRKICKLPPDIVEGQINAITEDIMPDAVKTGMLTDADTIHAVAEALKRGLSCPVVIDTVMVSTSGRRLLEEDALSVYCRELLPLATVITPNLPELEELYFLIEKETDVPCCGDTASMEERIVLMAGAVQQFLHTAVLVKGGHRADSSTDILFDKDMVRHYPALHIHNPNTHGTGCTLSAAIACNLAKGDRLDKAVEAAKRYVSSCIADGMNLGHGNGPLNHLVWQNGREV